MSERTKLWIAENMRKLMREKPLAKIRITDICREAQIDRSTFYYHFKDKYDLVSWIFFYSEGSINVTDSKEAAESLKRIKNDLVFYRRAYEDNSQNSLWNCMLDFFIKEYTRIAEEKMKPEKTGEQILFSIRLYCYGAVGMARDWVLRDYETKAEDVIEMMFRSMPDSLRKLYFTAG